MVENLVVDLYHMLGSGFELACVRYTPYGNCHILTRVIARRPLGLAYDTRMIKVQDTHSYRQ